MNKAQLIGRLGMDPEIRYTATSGKEVTNFSVCTTERYTDAEGKKHEEPEWHRVTAWGSLAKIAAEFLEKGRQVYVEGRLRTSEYVDKQGVKRKSTEIVATQIEFLDGKGSNAAKNNSVPTEAPKNGDVPKDDSIPF